MVRSALFESEGRWAVTSRRTLASEAIVRLSGPRPLFDDGRGLATCSSLENGHLRYLGDLWAICDGSALSVPLWLSGWVGGLCVLGVFAVQKWVRAIPNSEFRILSALGLGCWDVEDVAGVDARGREAVGTKQSGGRDAEAAGDV